MDYLFIYEYIFTATRSSFFIHIPYFRIKCHQVGNAGVKSCLSYHVCRQFPYLVFIVEQIKVISYSESTDHSQPYTPNCLLFDSSVIPCSKKRLLVSHLVIVGFQSKNNFSSYFSLYVCVRLVAGRDVHGIPWVPWNPMGPMGFSWVWE